jgi:hypothetical protein
VVLTGEFTTTMGGVSVREDVSDEVGDLLPELERVFEDSGISHLPACESDACGSGPAAPDLPGLRALTEVAASVGHDVAAPTRPPDGADGSSQSGFNNVSPALSDIGVVTDGSECLVSWRIHPY